MLKTKENKYKNLFLSLLFDAVGIISFSVPYIGDFSDIIWAPIAAWLMTRIYEGKIGKAAGLITFVEEISPGLDGIPTFTIMWLYTYILKPRKKTLDSN